ncbi:MAG: N-6 DNA methylase [Ardenticatenales bacterium]|nr:N-6 DNA methylase [Ardenticatenales bacterium]
MLTDSRTYAQGISDSLKEQVYEALAVLAQGFYDMPSNRLASDDATLKAVYDNSLIVLYRLLFVLYAEDRGVLPLASNKMFRETYSLQARKRLVAIDIERDTPVATSMDNIWIGLNALWRYIANGHPELDIPAYNGGLFDGARHPFLESHSVGDRALRRAIDLVARADDRRGGGRQFVDYRDLEVRHLGSIYEGLLEYRLRFAEADLAVTREKGREVYAPAVAGQSIAVAAGRVYLTTDKGERKSTGSYYTPDYIVQYIVEQTVGPVLEDLTGQHLGDGAIGSTATSASTAAGGGKAALVDAILSINILDPAMGSGHFLVAATEHVARHMVGLALDVPPDLGEEGELAYWRRRIVQACIYGVDVNPLAVELAKLSLWLATVARDRPLSFLDHHLRTGNSLVGARVADVPLGTPPRRVSERRVKAVAAAEAAGQLSMTTDSAFAGAMLTANGLMSEIEAMRSDTVEDVHAAEALFHDQVRVQTAKARRLADVWTARHFGLTIDEGTWPEFVAHILHGGMALPHWTAMLDEADRIAGERRFFHWELEFPEVFFDRFGRLDAWTSGFDAVIGNPPYVRQESLGDIKPFLATLLPDVYHGTADIFVYFIGQGLGLLRAGRRLSYVASNSWLRANYASPLRYHLRTECTVEAIVDLGDNRVFADAPDVYPAIVVIRNALPQLISYVASASTFTRGEGIRDFRQQVTAKRIQVAIHDQSDKGWQLGDDAARKLLAKLLAGGTPLGEVVEGRIYYGIKTGLNEAFIIDTATRVRLVQEDPRSAEIIRPIFRGEDLRPWYQEDKGQWLIFARRGIEIAAYPAIESHLSSLRQRLEPRPRDYGDSGSWPGRKPGNYQWFEIQDTVDYWRAFDVPKLIWPDIAKSPRFSLNEDSAVLANTAYFSPLDNEHALWPLASRCAWFVLMQIGQPLGERAGQQRFRLFDQYMAKLPIPTAPTPTRTALADLALRITAAAKSRYALHQRARRRIAADLGVPGVALNQKLTAWWTLEFPAFRAEVNKVFRRDIALRERDDWDGWLGEQRAGHEGLTAEIVGLETELNGIVYGLFDLTAAEVRLVEGSTKYRYGEV